MKPGHLKRRWRDTLHSIICCLSSLRSILRCWNGPTRLLVDSLKVRKHATRRVCLHWESSFRCSPSQTSTNGLTLLNRYCKRSSIGTRNGLWSGKFSLSINTCSCFLCANSVDRICRYPALGNLRSDQERVDKYRLGKTWEANSVSLRLIMFHVYFLGSIAKPKVNRSHHLCSPHCHTFDLCSLVLKRYFFLFLLGEECPRGEEGL